MMTYATRSPSAGADPTVEAQYEEATSSHDTYQHHVASFVLQVGREPASQHNLSSKSVSQRSKARRVHLPALARAFVITS